MAKKKAEVERNLKWGEMCAVGRELGKVRVKIYRMSEKPIYNAKAKRFLRHIVDELSNIQQTMYYYN